MRELLLAWLAAALIAAAFLFEPLFGGACTLSFPVDDPRVDMRPWARADAPTPPYNLIGPDVAGFVLPGLLRARAQLAAGEGVWWDPGQMLGYPFAANLPFPLLSPIAAATAGLDAVTALDVMLWIHFAVALALAYRLCRLLGAAPWAAAIGAVGFAFSAWMTTRVQSPHEVYTVAWWPAQLAAIEWARRGRSARAVAEGGAATGLMVLAGFPQHAALLSVTSLAVAAVAGRARTLAPVGAAVVLGLALGAPQWVESARAYEDSLRAAPSTRAAVARRGLPPAALVGTVLPEFFGRPDDFSVPDAPAPTMEAWLPHRRWLGDDRQNSVVYNACYPGVLLVLLVPVIVRRRAGPRAHLAAAAAALALLAAVGYPQLAALLPVLEDLAAANVKRLLVIVAGAWPIAAALALSRHDGTPIPVPWRTGLGLILALAATPALAATVDDPDAAAFSATLVPQIVRQSVIVAVALVLLALARRGTRGARGALVALLALDLVGFALAYHPFPPQPSPPVFERTETIETLARRPGRYVVFGGGPHLLPPTVASALGLRAAHGVMPLVPRRAAELLGCIEGPLYDDADPRLPRSFERVASLTHPVLDLLAVDAVVHADRTLAERAALPELLASERDGLGVLARPDAGPDAFWSRGVRVVTDDAERLAALASPDVDPFSTVLLETAPRAALPASGAWRPLTVERPRADEIRVDVEAPRAGVVVVTEAWDAGWSARVDGVPAPVLRAHHALLAIEIDEGRHALVLRHEPPHLDATFGAAAAALAVLLGATGLALTRRPAP